MDWMSAIILAVIIGGMAVGVWAFSKTDKTVIKKGGIAENHTNPSVFENKGKPGQYIIPTYKRDYNPCPEFERPPKPTQRPFCCE